MPITDYKVLRAPLNQIEKIVADAIADGWQPYGAPVGVMIHATELAQIVVKGTPDAGGGGSPDVAAADITDATEIGVSVLTAADAAAARTAIGAGTSSLVVGTGAGNAKPGNYAPAWVDVTGKPAVIASGADAAAARAAIGAGTSSLALGTTGTTAAAGNHTHADLATAAALAALDARVTALETA